MIIKNKGQEVTIHTIIPSVRFTGILTDLNMTAFGSVTWITIKTKKTTIKINTNHIMSITYNE